MSLTSKQVDELRAYAKDRSGSTAWIRSKQPLDGLWMSQLLGVYNL